MLLAAELSFANHSGASLRGRLLVVQIVAACSLAAALAAQHVQRSGAWWILLVAFVVGPLLVSAWELTSSERPSTPGTRPATPATVWRVTGALWLFVGSVSVVIGTSRSAPFEVVRGLLGLGVGGMNLWTASRWQNIRRPGAGTDRLE